MDDLISRRAAIDALNKQIKQCSKALGSLSLSDVDTHAVKVEMASLRAYREMLENLPTVQQEPTDEQVAEYCKRRCLHIVTDDFFHTIQSEPKEGHWILHESPDGGEQYECSECGVLWEFNDGTPEDNEAYFCPKCGKKLITK